MAAQPTQAEPGPREVRKAVIADHDELRVRMAQLTACLHIDRLGSGGAHVPQAREQFASLAEFFLVHLNFEDEYLVPLLRDDFTWGDMRARAMIEHHVEQRQELAELRVLVDSASTDPVELHAALDQFIGLLETDMEHEEQGILVPEVLGPELLVV
jgi:hypothetical protein